MFNFTLQNNQTEYKLDINQTCMVLGDEDLTWEVKDKDGNALNFISLKDEEDIHDEIAINFDDISSIDEPTHNQAGFISTTFEGVEYRSYFNLTVYECIDENCEMCPQDLLIDFKKGAQCSLCKEGYYRTPENECEEIQLEKIFVIVLYCVVPISIFFGAIWSILKDNSSYLCTWVTVF